MTLQGAHCRVGPCSGRVGPCSCHAGPCSCRMRVDPCVSGAFPCRSGAVLYHPCGCCVDSVFFREAAVFVHEHTMLAPAWWSLADLRCWKAPK